MPYIVIPLMDLGKGIENLEKPLRIFVVHEKVKIAMLTGVWKKVDSALMDDFEGLRFQWRK